MPEPISEPAALEGRPAPPRVLVVDDDDALRFALREGLSACGFEVDDAPDSATACQVAAGAPPDVILLDWIMRDGDGGAAACRRLREAAPEAPVVMFTGLDDVRDRRAALEAGASAFLVKGMDLDDLAGKLRAVVSSRR